MSNDKKMQEEAICEAHRNRAEKAYFDARPQIDFGDRRRVFDSGFDRGWQARAALSDGHGEPVAVVGDGFSLFWYGSGPIAPIIEKHGLKVGSILFAAPPSAHAIAEQMREQCDNVVADFGLMPRPDFYMKYGVFGLLAAIRNLSLPAALEAEPATQEAVEARLLQQLYKATAFYFDVCDDIHSNPPENRCYVDNASTQADNEVRQALAALDALIPAKAEPAQSSDELVDALETKTSEMLKMTRRYEKSCYNTGYLHLAKDLSAMTNTLKELTEALAVHRAKQGRA